MSETAVTDFFLEVVTVMKRLHSFLRFSQFIQWEWRWCVLC